MLRRAARRQRFLLLLGLAVCVMAAVALLRHPRQAGETNGNASEALSPGDTGLESPWPELSSPLDADGDGVDDWHDILQGARDYIAAEPVYNEYGYYDGGYPDDGTGVCTDVIWSALRAAGYDLKAMLDRDVELHPGWYCNIDWPEPNIDFRRVGNLDDFFLHHAVSLTCSLSEPAEWQPGDIVVFGDRAHIAICSDRRRSDGIPWIIHHGSLEEGPVEVDAMDRQPVTAHYRWLPAADDPVLITVP